MDMNERVAARRAELERQQQEVRTDQERLDTARQVAEESRRAVALEEVAKDLNAGGVSVERTKEGMEISREAPPLDIESMRKEEIEKILKKEARQRWTPAENWIVIGFITAGVVILPDLTVVGIFLIIAGVLLRYLYISQHVDRIKALYPSLSQPTAYGAKTVRD